MTTETEERKPENNPASSKGKEPESRPAQPRRAGRGRRNSRGRVRRGRGGTSERSPDKEQRQRKGDRGGSSKPSGEGKRRQGNRKSGSNSAEAGREGESGRGRSQQGRGRSRRVPRKQDSHREKQEESMAPDPSYVEPTAVFIQQYTRIPSSREYDTGMGQRPNWFVRWEKDFDQGYEH